MMKPCLCLSALCSIIRLEAADMVQNWQAYLDTPSNPDSYKVVFEWDHVTSEAVVIGHAQNLKPTDDPRCSGNSQDVAADGQPYWMPRFFPRPVNNDISTQTGIRFASVDWQPCGHKDITICHGESHYDFHLYYTPENELNSLSMCDIGTSANPHLPVCMNSANPANAAYFKLINQNMPVSAEVSYGLDATSKAEKKFQFCVDESSAILRSGVHYGDKSETLDEWKTPVSIIGSHDCQLMFFEPMISWKWISGTVPNSPWPYFKVDNIQYNVKTFEALPSSWSINVSNACKAGVNGTCHIQIVVEGTKCPSPACNRDRACGDIFSCSTKPLTTTEPLMTTSVSKGRSSSAFAIPVVSSYFVLAMLYLSIEVCEFLGRR